MSEWTEGVCGDGAAILRDGQPVAIADLLTHLNASAAEWKTVDSAPDDTELMLFCPNRHPTNRERIEIGVYSNSRGRWNHAWATHWAPLPKGPDQAEVQAILRAEDEREYRKREMEHLDHDGQL